MHGDVHIFVLKSLDFFWKCTRLGNYYIDSYRSPARVGRNAGPRDDERPVGVEAGVDLVTRAEETDDSCRQLSQEIATGHFSATTKARNADRLPLFDDSAAMLQVHVATTTCTTMNCNSFKAFLKPVVDISCVSDINVTPEWSDNWSVCNRKRRGCERRHTATKRDYAVCAHLVTRTPIVCTRQSHLTVTSSAALLRVRHETQCHICTSQTKKNHAKIFDSHRGCSVLIQRTETDWREQSLSCSRHRSPVAASRQRQSRART